MNEQAFSAWLEWVFFEKQNDVYKIPHLPKSCFQKYEEGDKTNSNPRKMKEMLQPTSEKRNFGYEIVEISSTISTLSFN